MIRIEAQGCQLGYYDKETGAPHCKPTSFITSMFVAESVFSGCLCPRDHWHQPLEGSNDFGRRTLQAAAWPDTLNRKVMDAMLQQAVNPSVTPMSSWSSEGLFRIVAKQLHVAVRMALETTIPSREVFIGRASFISREGRTLLGKFQACCHTFRADQIVPGFGLQTGQSDGSVHLTETWSYYDSCSTQG